MEEVIIFQKWVKSYHLSFRNTVFSISTSESSHSIELTLQKQNVTRSQSLEHVTLYFQIQR